MCSPAPAWVAGARARVAVQPAAAPCARMWPRPRPFGGDLMRGRTRLLHERRGDCVLVRLAQPRQRPRAAFQDGGRLGGDLPARARGGRGAPRHARLDARAGVRAPLRNRDAAARAATCCSDHAWLASTPSTASLTMAPTSSGENAWVRFRAQARSAAQGLSWRGACRAARCAAHTAAREARSSGHGADQRLLVGVSSPKPEFTHVDDAGVLHGALPATAAPRSSRSSRLRCAMYIQRRLWVISMRED